MTTAGPSSGCPPAPPYCRKDIVGSTGPVLAWLFGAVTLMIWPLMSTYKIVVVNEAAEGTEVPLYV